ncbi:MAG: hypothetical protein PHO01_13045 [Desulfotomaculaceae bacterium]|nr:hypothetical protein [Desulfotomaculaceae bacterium]
MGQVNFKAGEFLARLLELTGIKPVLQYRWQVRCSEVGSFLVYYGVRNYSIQGRAVLPVSTAAGAVLTGLDGVKCWREVIESIREDKREAVKNELINLYAQKIIVDSSDLKSQVTLANKKTCTLCVNNDYILPGLEFDERGVCAVCQQYEKNGDGADDPLITSEDEIMSIVKSHTGSRFEVMVLYTGGKDSSYLLWYLARRLGLKVLAVTLNMPYMNKAARQNILAAQKHLPEVDFIERTVSRRVINEAMRGQLRRVGSPCFCYILASILFYPLAVIEGIPLIMDGIEQVQRTFITIGAGRGNPTGGAKSKSDIQLMNETGAVMPYNTATRQYLVRYWNTLGHPLYREDFSWSSEYIKALASIKEALAEYYGPFLSVLDKLSDSTPGKNILLPQIKHLASNQVYGSWQDVAELLKREIGWQMPHGQESLLHTSCYLEEVKDYTQYNMFKNMRTTLLPQSIIEISAAVYHGLISREEGLRELAARGYLKPPRALEQLLADLEIDNEVITEGEMVYALGCGRCPSLDFKIGGDFNQ